MHLHPRITAIPLLALAAGTLGAAPQGAVQPASGAVPQIVSAAINPTPVHPGERVEADVATSADVISVEAHVKALTFKLDQVEPGTFRMTGTVPKIARFFKGTYHVTFVARCSGGKTTQTEQDVVLN